MQINTKFAFDTPLHAHEQEELLDAFSDRIEELLQDIAPSHAILAEFDTTLIMEDAG